MAHPALQLPVVVYLSGQSLGWSQQLPQYLHSQAVLPAQPVHQFATAAAFAIANAAEGAENDEPYNEASGTADDATHDAAWDAALHAADDTAWDAADDPIGMNLGMNFDSPKLGNLVHSQATHEV